MKYRITYSVEVDAANTNEALIRAVKTSPTPVGLAATCSTKGYETQVFNPDCTFPVITVVEVSNYRE